MHKCIGRLHELLPSLSYIFSLCIYASDFFNKGFVVDAANRVLSDRLLASC